MDNCLWCAIILLLMLVIINYIINNKKNIICESKESNYFHNISPIYSKFKIKIEHGHTTKCEDIAHSHADIGTVYPIKVISDNFIIEPYQKTPKDIQITAINKLKELNPDISNEYILENWKGSNVMYLMYSIDNKFIGSVAVDRNNFEPFISHLYVSITYRKKGYGERLLSHGIEYAKSFKFNQVKLWCADELVPYYVKTGWYKDVWNDNKNVWIMKKEL
jgi:predicted GNAT family acetyltransferase